MPTHNLITRIRAAFPIAAFVAPYTGGLKPTKPGWYIGRCPFHQSPSDAPNKRKFWVNAEKGICGCFVPRCQDRPPMDVINFYARLKGVSNQEAIRELAERLQKN